MHPSHLGCRRKEPPQSHRWPPSSRLAQGVGSALGRGDPHKRAQKGVPPFPVRIGDTPPKPVPAHPSPTRRERQLQCPSQIPPTLHSSPHLEGSRGPQKIPKKSRMLAGRSWTSTPNLGSSDTPVFSGKFRLSPASRQPCSVPMPILEVTPSFLLPVSPGPPARGRGSRKPGFQTGGHSSKGQGPGGQAHSPSLREAGKPDPPLPSPLAGLRGGLRKAWRIGICHCCCTGRFFALGWGGGRWEGGRGGESERAGTQACRAGLAYPLAPTAVEHPSPHPPHPHSQFSVCFLFGALILETQGTRITSSHPRHHLSLPKFQQHCPSQGCSRYHGLPHPPPPSQKVRCAPLRNWGSESETAFSLSHLSRSHRNKRRYTTHYLSKFLPSSPGHNWGFSKEREF